MVVLASLKLWVVLGRMMLLLVELLVLGLAVTNPYSQQWEQQQQGQQVWECQQHRHGTIKRMALPSLIPWELLLLWRLYQPPLVVLVVVGWGPPCSMGHLQQGHHHHRQQ